MQIRKKSTLKEKAVPFAAGAAVTAGAVVGVAAAKALSDKKTRKKVMKGLNSAKKQAVSTVSDMVEKRGEMVDMVKEKAKEVLPKKTEKKAARKIKVVKKAAEKKAPVKKSINSHKITSSPTTAN